MPYTKSFCKVVDGGRHESSLEDGTSESKRLECNFKQMRYQSEEVLVMYQRIL